MNFDVESSRIFECITGSRLYGTANGFSDYDFRGIAIPPMKLLIHPFMGFDQKDSGFEQDDRVIYALAKFIKLCADANPNIVELLFIPEQNIIFKHDVWNDIIENRNLFLSKKCKFTFTGYAFSQLQAIKTHRQWFINPPREKPTRKAYGLTDSPLMSGDGLQNALNVNHDFFKDEYRDELVRERNYHEAKRQWDNYVSWRDNRNPERMIMEERFGYDCYVDDTEFLTGNGWKKYSEVTNDDLLATINPINHGIEYQKILNRYCYFINENIFNIKTQVTHCKITKNHNLYVSRQHRSKRNSFSRAYDGTQANWGLVSCNNIKNGYYSHFHIVHYPNNNNTEYNVSDDYLKIMGLYVSEGSLIKHNIKNKVIIKGISISQLKFPNKIEDIINSVLDFTVHKYEFQRKERIELTYNIYDKSLANKLLRDCGEYSSSKLLPVWIIKLSVRQAKILLDSLISGDGTIKKYSKIYYTSSKKLADMVQILAIICGYHAKIWGYHWQYRTSMYQIYISNYYGQYGNLKKDQIVEEYYSGYVCCFEVLNGILITRLNGEVSIHGNCKHASHLFRLMTEGKELLLDGNITFPLPNADEILAIKNGSLSYEQVIEQAESFDKQFDVWYNESMLPYSADKEGLTELYFSILEKYYKRKIIF